jgi:rhamnose utilization protein RhaD (predicted bifunctional aldolase and dehydrogenase)
MLSSGVLDYIYLSKLFGACIDYVQATGGNISVKTDTELIIKKSGFAMVETTESKGYFI